MPQVWLNGEFVEESEASVSVRDTGLLHAAGVFTTMRAYRGKVFRVAQHLARLRRSCEALFIPLQCSDEQLTGATGELLARNSMEEARLRLTVTRGMAQQDPIHGLRLTPTVLLTATELEGYPDDYYSRGLTVIALDEQKLNPYDLQAGHKTLNYLSRLSALRLANGRGAGEALWFNVHNYLQSGSISNVFIVKDGALITPPTPGEMQDAKLRESMAYPRSAVLPGITRSAVMELAGKVRIEVRLASIDINQLLGADEVFLTNSIMQIMPVCRIERQAVGSEKPGRVTVRLTELLAELIEEETG
jgi:branched-chain amino acid aminotransferase